MKKRDISKDIAEEASKEEAGKMPLRGEEFEPAEERLKEKIEGYQKEEKEKSKEREALTEVMGAEKVTEEQKYQLRKEITAKEEEEAKKAERKAAVEELGPQKATKEQEEKFKPVEKEEFEKAA